jgi:hypothetical protein
MDKFNFNSRETYLAFRNEWKKEYLQLSNEIRELKARLTAEIKRGKIGSTIYSLLQRRRRAATMMQTLEEAKVEAARQWAANRQGEAA